MRKLCYFCEMEHNNTHACCATCYNQAYDEYIGGIRYVHNKIR